MDATFANAGHRRGRVGGMVSPRELNEIERIIIEHQTELLEV